MNEKIVYRNYGIADRFEDGTVELNKHLDDYPELKKSLLLHEARHTNNLRFNRKDLLHDLTSLQQLSVFQMMKFMIRHPFSIVQVFPIYKTKTAGWVYDEVASIYWGVLLIAIILSVGAAFLM